jgi:23S rRNA pseudouridine955/2504/2580 synthase
MGADMSGVKQCEVTEAFDGRRIDRWFKENYPDLPRSRLEKLLRTGQIRLDGGRVKASARLEEGQIIRVPPIERREIRPPSAAWSISDKDKAFIRGLVIYEDDAMIAINKPSGLAVQGGTNTTRHVDGLLDGLASKNGERPKLVHRLDKDTSGVLLLAKTAKSAKFLTDRFRSKEARKLYWALVSGVPRPRKGTINLALAKQGGGKYGERVVGVYPDEEDPLLLANAKNAVTHFAVMDEAAQKASFVIFWPETGRTHQLRAHSAAIGHPIAGDRKYGDELSHLGGEIEQRMHLHAQSLTIPHPDGGKVNVSAPLPPHMKSAWQLFCFDEEIEEDPFEDGTKTG